MYLVLIHSGGLRNNCNWTKQLRNRIYDPADDEWKVTKSFSINLVQSCVFVVSVPSIVVHKGSSRSHSRPESPTVVVRGGMPSLPSSRQGFVISGSNTSYQNSPESDMIDGNANPNVGSSPTSNSHHRSSPSCPPDKSDTENKNFRTRVRVWQWDVSRFPVSNSCLPRHAR